MPTSLQKNKISLNTWAISRNYPYHTLFRFIYILRLLKRLSSMRFKSRNSWNRWMSLRMGIVISSSRGRLNRRRQKQGTRKERRSRRTRNSSWISCILRRLLLGMRCLLLWFLLFKRTGRPIMGKSKPFDLSSSESKESDKEEQNEKYKNTAFNLFQ